MCWLPSHAGSQLGWSWSCGDERAGRLGGGGGSHMKGLQPRRESQTQTQHKGSDWPPIPLSRNTSHQRTAGMWPVPEPRPGLTDNRIHRDWGVGLLFYHKVCPPPYQSSFKNATTTAMPACNLQKVSQQERSRIWLEMSLIASLV